MSEISRQHSVKMHNLFYHFEIPPKNALTEQGHWCLLAAHVKGSDLLRSLEMDTMVTLATSSMENLV